MATAKMRIILPLVVWIWIISTTTAQSFGGIGFGIKREIFFLNLEDGYFGCQVNESTDVLQLYELSKLCDGRPNCFRGSDELRRELKCTDDCQKEDGTECHNGVCLDHQCHCNDGFGGCNCEVPDENECKYRPCDVFAHCTNTLGSFSCTCFPGYQGDGFHCEDINECEDPAIAARCVQNAECCNLPAHFLCKCLPGFVGDGEVECRDINECAQPGACGANALCQNFPGNYTCVCPEGFTGNPRTGCFDIDECSNQRACGPGAICSNLIGGKQCSCPPGYDGDAYITGCRDVNECLQNPCGYNALCTNLDGTFQCTCPPGFFGDPLVGCSDVGCRSHEDCAIDKACISGQCQNPCSISNPCISRQDCQVESHQPVCIKVCHCQKDSDCKYGYLCDGCNCVQGEKHVFTGCEHCPPGVSCDPTTGACIKEPGFPKSPQPCTSDNDCLDSEACFMSVCQDPCEFTSACAQTAKCQAKMHRPICTCPKGFEGNPAVKCFKTHSQIGGCLSNEDCEYTEACIDQRCQRPCDLHNPCTQNAVCINTNHGTDCSCVEGFHGNGYVKCAPVFDYKPVCQYNEDCPPDKLCDRLNRLCINPCFEDSCGENAECIPQNHEVKCQCIAGFEGNPYTICGRVHGCQSDDACSSNEACINGRCSSPCQCGTNAICEVIYHRATCKCPAGFSGNPLSGCHPPANPCDPNPCGLRALCELDNGNPICYCPKGLTGNPFKSCIPDGDECVPNPCGPNSGCRVVNRKAVCFCLPEFEGTPPQVPCTLPANPCDPSPCGPNTQCTILDNGFAKCTCLSGYLESPNTIRGCVEQRNPCEPNPCGLGALCDASQESVCFCPAGTIGNPYRSCAQHIPTITLCQPGPCGVYADCYVSNNQEKCYCKPGYIGDPYSGCRPQPFSPCVPNPCSYGSDCIVTPDGKSACKCPEGTVGDPTSALGCQRFECATDDDCSDDSACIGFRCQNPCHGCCGINANCRVEKHHPVCTCNSGLTGNPLIRCSPLPEPMPLNNPCIPSPCGLNTICQVNNGRAVCSCLPDFKGDPQFGCQPECILNSDCPSDKACINRHCTNPCSFENLCGINALCSVRDHTALCSCPTGYIGDPRYHCMIEPTITIHQPNITTPLPCSPSPCDPNMACGVYGTQIAICNPCAGPNAAYNPSCGPQCLTDADCPFDNACISYKCVDPCPGSCGVNADCNVIAHTPVCFCPQGLVGNPFDHCIKPEVGVVPKVETCENVACGANAECTRQRQGLVCVCKEGFYGNPWLSCHPECVVNSDCPLTKSCINNKCVNPCNGVCGVGANCDVANHVPICFCPVEHTGDPFVSCFPILHPTVPTTIKPLNPCDPSPCGPYSRCMISLQGFATCSCLPGCKGVPPTCKPECIVTSECPQTQACINQKCVDPCQGTCGANAFCKVINHNPVCSCPPGQQGDPFTNCYTPIEIEPKKPENPCLPSPCGPNSICQINQGRPVCSCVANYIGNPPYCRPECVINQECPSDKACIKERCVDPCPGSCGQNARCNVVNHTPFCSCLEGFKGDAFVGCEKIIIEIVPKDPCNPSPCGVNAQCSISDGVARCSCIPPYIGNPYAGGCRPECTINSECASNLACIAQHCRNPCEGLCGLNAECTVTNHIPACSCIVGFTGDPFTACRKQPEIPEPPKNPCEPSPCGLNSLCRVSNNHAICSCQEGFFGAPPNCRPECLVSSECSLDKACINQKCQDPCRGSCGLEARCQTINHNPVCSCPPLFTGDPFVSCIKEEPKIAPPMSPCIPSPCGINAECRVVDSRAVCSCLPEMFGAPPNCRPECLIHQDCPLHLACFNNKCKDPCIGSCGFNAQCVTQNHRPICSCIEGFEGDPFSGCNPIQAIDKGPPTTPCSPSPCGPNSECRERNNAGSCSCLPGFEGNPYDKDIGCRRECENNNDCSPPLACVSFKCKDPCPGTCGVFAECQVINHIPTCTCIQGYTGDPFYQCNEIIETTREPENPCQPTPCGPNSQCRNVNQQAVCSCLPSYIGTPPQCRPECVVSSECPLDKACINRKCSDPCPNTCGIGAQCSTRNHHPICACPPGYTGDPFSRCSLLPEEPKQTERTPSCYPSPCGPNSQCQMTGGLPSCSCLTNYIGTPPNCRPECVLNSECGSELACINQKCQDPCPGSCGSNARCHVLNHTPICTCQDGLTGDPFVQCVQIPATTTPATIDPCNPSPCGPNAICRDGVCSCLPEYQGNPYESCRPECIVSSECNRDKACVRNKCVNPCIGTCGNNAQCDVINHIPVCSCADGFTGDPFTNCRVADKIPPEAKLDPCSGSPCGPNSQCRSVNGQAVCSCLQGYMGSPPSCKPECIVSNECPPTKTCINQKCTNPCLGSCGLRARCEVIHHNPICSCPEGMTGDPFAVCQEVIRIIEERPEITNPCQPSPCGPNSECKVSNAVPVCQCRENYIGQPPNCRPECVINPDCPTNFACINNRCRDPCPGSCGENAECRVVSHTVSCSCLEGYTGNPFVQCLLQKTEIINPCEPSPCGSNAICIQRNGVGACSCIEDYQGNPYEGCRPECILGSDCPTNRACIRSKCQDPCPGICGQFAECSVVNHIPVCTCITGYIGDPFSNCYPAPPPQTVTEAPVNPCNPSPCGPNSQCRNVNGQGVCSCLPEYTGAPPNCKPECVVNSECPQDRACHKFKCTNPCAGTCGINARCEVINHNPICSCGEGLTGDPFTRCVEVLVPTSRPATNPCNPSPCGSNSECRVVGDQPSCSCLRNYIGVPPNCRPECSVNTDCNSNLACISEKCRDPCPGSCGFNAACRVQNHIPICTCVEGFTGDPFTQCTPHVEPPRKVPTNPCQPSPCGPNAQCDNGVCTCLTDYQGDPYRGCRPECTMNTDCSPNRACINKKCVDPCPGTCGQSAECDVVNHIPTCSCPINFEGDPFVLCKPIVPVSKVQPCSPSPCGPNSLCKVNNDVAVCSCQLGFIGSPPNCRPECVVSAECPLTQACLNNKCVDPCPGTCGISAQCQTINHNPICSCNTGLTGDPFVRCYPIQEERTPEPINPCEPSPCGPNSACRVSNGSPACSCLQNYVGLPPSCRPECTINSECRSNLACINQKCRDPCPGACGSNAVCAVINHNTVCSCNVGFTGDPFSSCVPVQVEPPIKKNPCAPSPCGPNTHCRIENDYALCECLPEYHGNPYESCRPECLVSSDCSMNLACIRNKCQDPCPGTCGVAALCTVSNHIPICSCPDGLTGDAFRLCMPIPKIEPQPTNPCEPSPCGINTICRVHNGNAICECQPGFFGTPAAGGCRPECTISADCSRDKACVNNKCVDPCVNVCGFGAQCQVINHSPICSCPIPLAGDPFVSCTEQRKEPQNPCQPSPCGPNGHCKVINEVAVCTYPECVVNSDCPRDKTCYLQKCVNPCIDACGINALCQVVNHKPVCACPVGFTGTPEVSCQQLIEIAPKPECVNNDDCSNDKSCINSRCVNPCAENVGSCGLNAQCFVQLHRAICVCSDGYTGNAQTACIEIGCRADSDCPVSQSCINRECIDPCTFTQCGVNAFCKSTSRHRATCFCPPNYKGDPYVQCEKPECVTDSECPLNLACRNERCENPCNCGVDALCIVNYHQPQCSCSPGFTGNPAISCTAIEIPQPQCRIDADCPSKYACFSGTCQNPCLVTKPCGVNTECIVVDTLPLKTMSCTCLPNYVGDANLECRKVTGEEKKTGCRSNEECPSSDACINGRCINPCIGINLCGENAKCYSVNHRATCKCPPALIGDPFVKCYEVSISVECKADSECPVNKACINTHCEDPCILSPCGTGSQCRVTQHRPICVCPEGWGGDPQLQCYRPECTTDSECPYDKSCINRNCVNPCVTHSCGRGAECVVQNHLARCQCPSGTQGNPLVSCIAGVCQYNEDCADHEACDRLNRVCRPVCNDDTCATTAHCVGRNHQPICSCPFGTTGNPFVQCSAPLPIPIPSPICRIDSDCPSHLTCINSICQDPCAVTNICTSDQECSVTDSSPLRTVMCKCPQDTFVDETGHCKSVIQLQCHTDYDCGDREKCRTGYCIEACKVDICGYNALCNSLHHQAVCTCAAGYSGNPHIECTREVKSPIPLPIPECSTDGDCPLDKSCRNDICINPCVTDKPCGLGALCAVRNHQPNCNCPQGYQGNPSLKCIAPSLTVGCKSSSDCSGTEACVNELCINPCNCGPNAECTVANHYPICFCKPGYSGHPDIGCVKLGCQSDSECASDKQCYNGQCLNPCILENPCARNAECYGSNHRALCRCPDGYSGNPFNLCERVECSIDSDCPNNRACLEQHCVNPCTNVANPPCAENAICYVQNHAAGCQCPPHLPEGNPLSYCLPITTVAERPECELDLDCPSKLACISNKCENPCSKLSPCHRTASCNAVDTVPVRTLTCTCPEGWMSNDNGECQPVIIPVPPGCTSDDDCSDNEACVNRICRNPCNCGTHTICFVQNHRPICSCKDGFDGNPNIACHMVGCRSDSECGSGRACINANCIDPCLIRDPCGTNAECFTYNNRAQCRCLSGFRGNPYDKCLVIGCRSNSDCPNDRQCVNAQCVNPCVHNNPCSPRAECKVQNHISLCKCPSGYNGNPYIDCHLEPQPECRQDSDCPSTLACLNRKCQEPCSVLTPCQRPAECKVIPSIPLRTMICVCPPGYISSGKGTCRPTTSVREIGACVADSECPSDKACINALCRNPCTCGSNAECTIRNHKPICTCKVGFEGNPEIECVLVKCRSDDDCSSQHTCVNQRCVPACAPDGSSCGTKALCYPVNHRAICDCPPGLRGDPAISCVAAGCRSNSDCPTDRACINKKCANPCAEGDICDKSAECKIYNHVPQCACPPGFVNDQNMKCRKIEEKCKIDSDCPLQLACIESDCVNPCNATQPCGINAKCKVANTIPVRTMVCECLPGYQGNAIVRCDKVTECRIDKGYIRTSDGKCICPPPRALNDNDDCIPCLPEQGFKIDESGRCVCDLERGFIIDERGNCVCPTEHGYRLNKEGNCIPTPIQPECETDDDCADDKLCKQTTKTCEDACLDKICGENAFCNATRHRGICQCRPDYVGDAEKKCISHSSRKDFPPPEIVVSCLSDGVKVKISIAEQGFNGVLYVKGHSKDEQCRRIISLPSEYSEPRTEIFKVQFGNCGLIHVNGQASFVLVIQKHPKLVTYKAQAYHIKCVYQTGEQNITLGFNVSMLTTAGTIANTGPPPICTMKIVTQTGDEVNSAEIGDNLMLQVEVQPGSIYGGFARSCVAKTMGDKVENEYLVTDENGCATDPTIFGEWDYNADTQSLLASFNAFKFPSSNNIRFQCNIRVCFGRCQPVNCRGYNAFGRRKRDVGDENSTDVAETNDLMSGQLREEITIQSNAILTFERRDERPADYSEASAQRVEDICVSIVGFIIALVLTALLALVAIAVAVSCWLMAYRRKPKISGPLPHPPEFPNPLFTTPEPMAEPSPDYLT